MHKLLECHYLFCPSEPTECNDVLVLLFIPTLIHPTILMTNFDVFFPPHFFK